MGTKQQTLFHNDIVKRDYHLIQNAFASAGGIAPNMGEIHDSSNWKYCQTLNKKHKGKIGYVCSFLQSGKTPRVKIVIHSFAEGGSSTVFDSWHSQNKEAHTPPSFVRVKTTTHKNIKQQQEAADKAQKAKKEKWFNDHKSLWESGSPCFGDHPYVKTKKLSDNPALKIISGDRLAYPIYNSDKALCGIQTISATGEKRIYGQKKGAFHVLGDLEAATRVYLCEGYATGNALYKIVELSQKRKVPYCVVIALDAKNLEAVTSVLKSTYKNKILTLCPDNDHQKVALEKNNVGLLSGYSAALAHHLEIKVMPTDLCDGTDWCDAYLAKPMETVIAFREKQSIKPFDYACARLTCFANNKTSTSLEKACVSALTLGAHYYPAKLTEKNLLTAILAATAHTALSARTIKRWWSRIKRRAFAKALRAKSLASEQSDRVKRIEVVSMQAAHEQLQVLKEKHPRALFITNAPMGIGKTKDFIQPEFMAADIQGQIPVVITPTRALTKGVSERFHASHYIDDVKNRLFQNHGRHSSKGNKFIPSGLAITINSIIAPKFKDVLTFTRAVFIDEYTQVLRAITSGTVEAHKRRDTEQRLANLIVQSQYAYIADADFNQIALDQIEAAIDDRPIFIFTLPKAGRAALDKNTVPEPKKPTPIIETPVTYRYYQHTDQNFIAKYLFDHVITLAGEGKRIYVASDSKTQLETLASALRFEKKDTLLITADNSGFTAQRAFLDDPNAYLKTHSPQVVLVSPCVQSGVSIEVDYFERCVGIYAGTVSPVVFQQMLHRVRPQREFDLALPPTTTQKQRALENPTALLVGAYTEHLLQQGGHQHIKYDPSINMHTIGSISIQNEKGVITLSGDPAYARYETLSAKMKALDAEQTHHAANFLLRQAMARGVTLKPIEIDANKSDRDAIKTVHACHKTLQKEEQIKNIVTARNLDKAEYEALKNNTAVPTQTAPNLSACQKFEIAKDLGMDISNVAPEDVAFYQDGGVGQIANFQALRQGVDQAKANDQADASNGVAKTDAKWREQKVRLLQTIFSILKLSKTRCEGEYTKEAAKLAREAIKDDPSLTRYVTFKCHLSVDNQLSDTAFINKLLRKLLGLRVDRGQVREREGRYWVYQASPISRQKLVAYHRQKFGESDPVAELSPENLNNINMLICDASSEIFGV